jgi:2-polyprenyl-6-methoxyphenol hydroxylase-like FAD-dependent oxidoreductase
MAPFKVIIIGSGLAGSLLGNGLMHNDVDFMIYESDERNSSREGYQIRLGSPALIGFRACLTSEQQNALYKMFGRSGGMISSAPKLYDTHLKLLLDLTKFPAYTKSAPINRVILRNFLQQPLDEARRVCFGKRFEKYELMYGDDGHSTGVKAIFDDGSEDSCDLLISAEGSVSKVNKQIGLNNIVQLTEKWGFLAKGNLPIHKLASLTPEVRSSPMAVINGGVVLFYSGTAPSLRLDDYIDT